MPLTVFPFARSVRPRCEEWPDFATRKAKLTGGFTERSPDYGADFLLRSIFSLEFPQRSTSKSIADFLAFIEEMRGAALPFRMSFYTDRYRERRALALGTGDGANTDFALPHRYIQGGTVVGYKAGVSAPFTLINNDTAPLIRFNTAPGGGVAVTADYDFYVPCHFEQDSLPATLRAAFATDAKRSIRIDGVQIEEAQPGARLV